MLQFVLCKSIKLSINQSVNTVEMNQMGNKVSREKHRGTPTCERVAAAAVRCVTDRLTAAI